MINAEVLEKFYKEKDLRLEKETIYYYRIGLNRFFRFCPKMYKEVKAADIRSWLLDLNQSNLRPGYIQTLYTAVRSFYQYCLGENLVACDPTKNVEPPKRPELWPNYLSRQQLAELREESKSNVRDRAIIETLYTTGVRISELVHIKLTDIDWQERKIHIERGKGKRARLVFFTRECATRLQKYLACRKDTCPSLFVNSQGKQLSVELIRFIFRGYAKNLNFKITPHILRHTFAAHLAEKGMPLTCIQLLLGHENIKNTRIYTKLYAQARKKAYDQYT